MEPLLMRGKSRSRQAQDTVPRNSEDVRFPPLSLQPSTNLPHPLTSFIGRNSEMAEVTQRLSVSRLLTLTGPGGCGKTRLALEVASGVQEHFAHGVWYVELAAFSDQALVPEIVASTLGIREYPERSLTATLLAYFQHRELLLILDNCEHVIAACARLAADLLGSCPQLRILATSREALTIAGETVLPVSPLTFPDPHELQEPGRRPSIERLKHYEAIQLFLERASLALPTFTFTEQNAPAIVRLCQRLDGIPLAIELAAARVRVLSVQQIAARLEKNCRLLGGGSRTAPPRQQTLEATMDWSYALLTSAEQHLFQRLSVFAGSFTLEAAEAICETGGLEPREVAGLLFDLVNKSLLVVEHRGGEARYRLLETLRRYGQEKLCSVGGITELCQRHRDWYLTFAEQAASALFGAEQHVWLERLEREHDNLRAALRWTLERRNAEAALRLANALWNFWHLHAHLSEGRQWLEAALAQSGRQPRLQRAKALDGLGLLASLQGDYERARRLHEESLALHWEEEQGKQNGKLSMYPLYFLGRVLSKQGDYERSIPLLEESLTRFRERGEQLYSALVLDCLGATASQLGNYERAQTLLGESQALWQGLGDKEGVASSLHKWGDALGQQGNTEQATSLLEHSLALFRELGDRSGIVAALRSLGFVALKQGDDRQASALLRESLVLAQEIGDKGAIVKALEGLASTIGAHCQGDDRGAAPDLEEVSAPDSEETSKGCALLAARLWGSAEALRHTIGAPLAPAERLFYEPRIAAVRARVNETTFLAAWAEGQAMPLEQAIACANAGQMEARETVTRLAPEELLPHELRIFALGVAQVYRGERALAASDWTYIKGRELLYYLLCHRPRTREQIGLALWPDASPAQLRSNLRATLYHLRRALGRSDWILFDGEHYAFNRSLPYWFDVEAFESAFAEVQQVPAKPPLQAVLSWEKALSLYRGDFLEDVEAGDWSLLQREALRRCNLEALLIVGKAHFAHEHYTQAARAFLQLLSHDSYHETAHRELMRCYARMGEQSRALQHYQALFAQMRAELGFAPDPATTDLYERLRRGEQV
jgi:predicted ATPase/DNA-binding SARP family transcriptional activator